MSLWDRLSRLAKSELNHAADRVRETVEELRTGERAGSKDQGDDPPESAAEPESGAGASSGSSSRWPREIRQAYAALELPLGADRDAVKDAYRDMMLRYHPDRHTSEPDKAELANELTVRIRQSYERLDAYLAKQQP